MTDWDTLSLRPPWEKVDDSDGLVAELKREAAPWHALRWKKLRAVARRVDCDDVLFALEDGSGKVAVVHLTWTREWSRHWPSTVMFGSLSEWVKKEMHPDADDYASA